MKNHNLTEEQRFFAQYNIADYERPSIAADIVVFSILPDGEKDSFRKLPKKALKLLMIKRGSYPYKDCWALPGGFVKPGEDVCETAKRELFEETNVGNAYLKLAGIFGEDGRDPRGWIISNTFLALMDGELCSLRAGTDAWEAKWFSVKLKEMNVKKKSGKDTADIRTEYELFLVHEEAGIYLTAKIVEHKQFKNYHETVRYELIESEGMAFDHAKIIVYTLLFLRRSVENDSKIVFDLMPETFTLTQLQNAFEYILDQKLLTANFRRKITDYVLETEEMIQGAGHRPAKLFCRNVEAFYRQ